MRMKQIYFVISTILWTPVFWVQGEIRDILNGASVFNPHESFSSPPDLEENKEPSTTERNKHDSSSTRPKRTAKHVQIISGSLELVSGTFGLAARSFKISGDTAAGILGSSLRLVGAVVKTTGSRLDSIGNSIHPPLYDDRHGEKYPYFSWSTPHTSSWWRQSQNPQRRILYESRSAAAKSVQFLGSVVHEIGDVLAVTGAAAEALGSMVASIAEESLRVGETITDSFAKLSVQSLDRSTSCGKQRRKRTLIRRIQKPLDDPIVAYNNEELLNGSYQRMETKYQKDLDQLTVDDRSSVFQAFSSMIDFLSQDTDGIPSQATELFVALMLCYFATIYFMKSGSYAFSHTIIVKQEIDYTSNQSSYFRGMRLLFMLPIKLLLVILQVMFHLLFHRYTLLVMVYGLIWIQLCHMSQIRSQSIYHKAEMQGYRLALRSLQSNNHGVKESTIWWNTLIHQIWRVSRKTCPRYPDFVLKGIPGCRQEGKQNSYSRPRHSIDDMSTSDDSAIYGGLEPYLSWILGTAGITALDRHRQLRTRSMTFALSVNSLSLGDTPPIIRHIEILHQDSGQIEFLLDWDFAMNDLNIVLDLQLSSLEFARLPTTQIAIGSLIAFRQKVKIIATSLADPPFFSIIKISLVHPLDCKIRISAVGDERFVCTTVDVC
jgi:hypothetical protein